MNFEDMRGAGEYESDEWNNDEEIKLPWWYWASLISPFEDF